MKGRVLTVNGFLFVQKATLIESFLLIKWGRKTSNNYSIKVRPNVFVLVDFSLTQKLWEPVETLIKLIELKKIIS
jgi:hypothetical protein